MICSDRLTSSCCFKVLSFFCLPFVFSVGLFTCSLSHFTSCCHPDSFHCLSVVFFHAAAGTVRLGLPCFGALYIAQTTRIWRAQFLARSDYTNKREAYTSHKSQDVCLNPLKEWDMQSRVLATLLSLNYPLESTTPMHIMTAPFVFHVTSFSTSQCTLPHFYSSVIITSPSHFNYIITSIAYYYIITYVTCHYVTRYILSLCVSVVVQHQSVYL